MTIAIATHNRRDDLCRTLERIRSLHPRPHEVLVVLDGCTDGSKEEVVTRFPEIIVTENSSKQGSIPSRDTAFRSAGGDIIVSLDDDSYPLQSDFVSRVLKLAADHPEAGVFAFREVRSEWPNSYSPPPRESIGHYVSNYANCAGAIRRSLYGEGVTYPRFLGHMYEEPDSCLQAYGAGYAVWYEPSILVFHHASPIERNVIGRHHLNARNELWSVILRCPFPHYLWVGPYRIGRQFVFAASHGWMWVRKEPQWWVSAARGIGECLDKRRPLPWKIYWNWMNLSRRPVADYPDMLRRFSTVASRTQSDPRVPEMGAR